MGRAAYGTTAGQVAHQLPGPVRQRAEPWHDTGTVEPNAGLTRLGITGRAGPIELSPSTWHNTTRAWAMQRADSLACGPALHGPHGPSLSSQHGPALGAPRELGSHPQLLKPNIETWLAPQVPRERK